MTALFDQTVLPELFDLTAWEQAAAQRQIDVVNTVHARLAGFDLEGGLSYAGAGFPIYGMRHRKTGFVFHLIPGGRFLMGLTADEAHHLAALDVRNHRAIVNYFPDAMLPVHEVHIGPLLACRLPVTEQAAARHASLKSNPGRPDFDGEPHAPIYMDFEEACSVLKSTGLRMLSESEYEYVTRCGRQDLFYFGNQLPDRATVAQICASDFQSMVDDGYSCNRFGLFGLAVGSFCSDAWHASYLGSPSDGSPWLGAASDAVRVVRGGATSMWPWHDAGEWMTLVSAMRLRSDYMYEQMAGLRLACSLEEAAALA